MNRETQTADEILNVKEACAFLKISRGTLAKLHIPKIKIRRRIFFKKSDILKFITENTHEVENDS
jgi:predicted DNA-binding transcriptional regulator AlpA